LLPLNTQIGRETEWQNSHCQFQTVRGRAAWEFRRGAFQGGARAYGLINRKNRLSEAGEIVESQIRPGLIGLGGNVPAIVAAV
jgi:hypothetical protein